MGVSAAPETVRLSNSVWAVDITTQSIAVNAYPIGEKTAVPISSAQTGFSNVTGFTQKDNAVSWKLPEHFLTVRFELIGESLSVEFIQDKLESDTLRLTWPIIEDFRSLRGYILPFFEGSYVPKDDVTWQDFLSEQGPIDTTAGLSMPFWGLDLGERTLTYILTNPSTTKFGSVRQHRG